MKKILRSGMSDKYKTTIANEYSQNLDLRIEILNQFYNQSER